MSDVLPDRLSTEEWHAVIAGKKNADIAVSYEDVVNLAKVAPYLRMAFDNKFPMNEDAVVMVLTKHVMVAHGFDPSNFREEFPMNYEAVIEAVVEESENSALHFRALRRSTANLLFADYELDPRLKHWAISFLRGNISEPQRKRGPSPYPAMERDDLIRFFLKDIDNLGYPITENEGSYRELSACHAIFQALSPYFEVPLPKTLMNIWSKRSCGNS